MPTVVEKDTPIVFKIKQILSKRVENSNLEQLLKPVSGLSSNTLCLSIVENNKKVSFKKIEHTTLCSKKIKDTKNYEAKTMYNLPKVSYCRTCFDYLRPTQRNCFSSLKALTLLEESMAELRSKLKARINKPYSATDTEKLLEKFILEQKPFSFTRLSFLEPLEANEIEKQVFTALDDLMHTAKQSTDIESAKEKFRKECMDDIAIADERLPMLTEGEQDQEGIIEALYDWGLAALTNGVQQANIWLKEEAKKNSTLEHLLKEKKFYPKEAKFKQEDFDTFADYLEAELEDSAEKALLSIIDSLEKIWEEKLNLINSKEKVYYLKTNINSLAAKLYEKPAILLVSERTAVANVYTCPEGIKVKTYLQFKETFHQKIQILGKVQKGDTPEMLEVAVTLFKEGMPGEEALKAARSLI